MSDTQKQSLESLVNTLELYSQKLVKTRTEIEEKIDSLQTKDGASAFISERINAIEPELHKLSPTMAWQCQGVVDRMRAEPSNVVAEQIAKMEARKADIERELKVIDEKPIDPIIKEVKR